MHQAHTTALLGRVKDFPPLRQLLANPPRIIAQTPDEVWNVMTQWQAAQEQLAARG